MLLNHLKKRTDKSLKSFAYFLHKLGFTPNSLTLVSFMFTIGAVALFAFGKPFYAGLALLVDYFLDLFDGLIARTTNQKTDIGYFLDRFTDATRRTCWIAMAASGLLTYSLAAFALLIDSFGFLIPQLLFKTKLRVPKWLFVWTGWLMIPGALLGQLVIFTQIAIVLGAALIVLNFLIIIFLNLKSQK
ncbi:CDP-alcohol phosphatidyltransferase family protein [Nanoarchaeota archaeon]